MNQIVRGFDALHGQGQRCRIEHIAGRDLDARRHARRQTLRLPCQAPHAPAIFH
jgi:hypothetical protein